MRLKAKVIPIIIFEPKLTESVFFNSRVVHNLDEFKQTADVIIANRITPEIQDAKDKVYSRDLFGGDV